MKILGLDTTGQTASVAIIEDDKLLAEISQNHGLTHSQTIMPMIAEICKQTETDLKDLDYIACAAGPGSFTGLRIGAATAKGLCLGTGKKLIPVPTLDALAYDVYMTNNIVCPIMDARRGQVYGALYEWEGERLVPLTEAMAVPIEEIISVAENFERDVIFLGDGVPVHRTQLAKHPEFHFAPAHCSLQRGAAVASLGKVLAEEGKAVSGENFSLIYLRKSQAEREREERLKKEGEVHV